VTVLSGFLTDNGGKARGRPVWLAWDKTGALLVSDDTSGIIWRVEAPGAELSKAPGKANADSLPPLRELDATINREFQMKVTGDYVEE
jgi:hypothetical protein